MRNELDDISRKTRKVIMYMELYPRSDVDRLYISRRGRRGLIECNCMKVEEGSFAWYVKHHIKPLIVAVRNCNTLPGENLTQPKEFSYVKFYIDKIAESPLFRMRRRKNKTYCD